MDYYYVQDANFNVTAVVENDGDVVERYQYSPYGQVTFLETDFDVAGSQVTTIGNTHLYTGRERDPETGLQLNRHRFYAAHLGRWVNRDPIGYVDGYNLYAAYFVPNGVDPLGLETVCCTQWTRRFVTLGYTFDQVGAMECILDILGTNPVYAAAISAVIASGTASVGAILRMLKVPYAGTLGPLAALALQAKFLNDFANAANYCRFFVCTQTVPKVEGTKPRSWYNPMYWIGGPEYECLVCPQGSEEVELNEGTQAIRKRRPDDPQIPEPPPENKLVWPRPVAG